MVGPASAARFLKLNYNDFNGLVGIVLLILAISIKLLRIERLPVYGRWLASIAVALIVAVPIFKFSAAVYIRGLVGDLSLTSLVLLILSIGKNLTGVDLCLHRQCTAVYALAVAVGLFFYPMSLGWGNFDPYSLGYGSIQFLACLLIVCGIAWFRNYLLINLCLVVAVGAYSFEWYASNNLWDYLIDPLLVVYGIFSGKKYLSGTGSCKSSNKLSLDQID